MKKLSKRFYKDFPNDLFKNEPRHFCYELSRDLIKKAKDKSRNDWYKDENTIRAILLLLFCWNFAAKITKKLNKRNVLKLLKNQSANLKNLEAYSILDHWEQQEKKIKVIYSKFKKVFGQTGASKALSILNPKFFVMWDTEIRKFLSQKKGNKNLRIVGLGNGESSESYFLFLKGIKNIIRKLKLDKKIKNKENIAKRIDEYHYTILVQGKK